MSDQQPTQRRLTRGHLEERSGCWWNRFAVERVDVQTGELRRGQARVRVGRFRSRAAAERALDDYLALERASDLAPGPSVTLAEFAAKYDRSHIALLRRTTQRTYRAALRCHLLPHLGALPLHAIGAEQLQGMVAALHGAGRARSTIRASLVRALQLLRQARKEGFAVRDIGLRAVTLPREQDAQPELRTIAPEELQAILAASTCRRQALWGLLAYAGLRGGEALALRWCDLDLAAGVLYVSRNAVAGRVGAPKSVRSARAVPILPQLTALLAAYQAESGGTGEALLFGTRNGRPIDGNDVRRRWLAPMLRRLGLAPAGLHSFRHSTPRLLDSIGMTAAEIQRWLGHTNIRQTEHYLHVDARDLRQRLDAALSRARASTP